MNDKELRKVLAMNIIASPDSARKKEVIDLVVGESSAVRPTFNKSFFRQLLDQIPYISKLAWVLFSACMVFLCYMFFKGYYNTETLLGLSTLTPFLSAMAFCEVLKSYYSKMWELEQSCKYNLQQIMSLRLIIIGSVNYITMLVFFIFCMNANLKAGIVLFLIIIPYQCENIVFFKLIQYFRSFEKSGFIVMCTAVLMSVGIYLCINIATKSRIDFSSFMNTGNALLLTVLTFGIMLFYNIRLRNSNIGKEDSAQWN